MDEVVDRQSSPSPSPPIPSSHSDSNANFPSGSATTSSKEFDDAMKASEDALEASSQLLRQSFVTQDQERKSTGATYDRHFKAYISWWDADQARIVQQNPLLKAIPSLPITVAKVTMFLNHEMTRPKAIISTLHCNDSD
jgi:hypothetical protein